VIFSAGNFGRNGDYSLATPGHAKNSLTVGAVTNSPKSFVDSGKNVGLRFAGIEKSYQIFPAALTQGFSDKLFVDSTVVNVDFTQNCQVVDGQRIIPKSLLFLKNMSDCSFDQTIAKLQNYDPQVVFVSEKSGSRVQLPSIYLSVAVLNPEDAEFFSQKIQSENAKITFPVELSKEYDLPSIPPFSSIGPTSDQRIKPDILAPGMSIISALSDGDPNSNNCNGGN
jgi:hypothetical protein